MKYSIERIKPNPPDKHIHHRCTRNTCNHRGEFIIHMGYKKAQVCMVHASEFCKRHGLHVPVESEDEQANQEIVD